MTTLTENFVAARRVSTPLIAITTPDPAATTRLIVEKINGTAPKFLWDVVSGLVALNEEAEKVLSELDANEVMGTQKNPVGCLTLAKKLPAKCIVFMANAQRFVEDVCTLQAIWNLRDEFKRNQRTLVLLGPAIKLPVELRNDIVEFSEPLPGDAELQEIVRGTLQDAQDSVDFDVTDELVTETAAALKGTSAFTAEQLTAMSIRKSKIDREYLDNQARRLIDQTPGLTFEQGTETFADIGGLEFIRTFGEKLFSGPKRPAVVVRIEELEKSMQGSTGGDLSGTSSDALQVLLSELEDNEWTGLLAFGIPGSGKSLFSKALANSFNAKPFKFDVNACKGSLVGQSEQNIRAAMEVIKTIGEKRVFFIASVNRLESLPPELQRRFTCGVWMFDAPSAEDRETIWRINMQRYGLYSGAFPLNDCPDQDGLTGADIRNICSMAHTLQCTLSEALDYVVPLKTQSPQVIDDARQQAHMRFIDAANGGVYRKDRNETRRNEKTSRFTEITN